MKGWLTGKVIGKWPLLILIGDEDFLFLIMIGEKIARPNEYRMKVEIPSFNGTLVSNSSWTGAIK